MYVTGCIPIDIHLRAGSYICVHAHAVFVCHPNAPETYITELDKEPAFTNTLKPMRKFSGSVPGNKIISPPPVKDPESPIYAEDTSILAFGL